MLDRLLPRDLARRYHFVDMILHLGFQLGFLGTKGGVEELSLILDLGFQLSFLGI